MFALVWWNYPLIAATTLGSMLLAYAWVDWRERREDDVNGPRPCLAHMGRNVNGMDLWCWQTVGHDGVHTDWWDQDDVREWDESDRPNG